MTAPEVTVPSNVLRFEVAAYLSLMLDTLSAAIQAISAETDDQVYGAVNIINVLFILAFVFLVGLAARRRKNWARLVLLAALALAAVSLTGTLSAEGAQLTTGIDLISVALTAYGLYCSFTGNARGWFTG
jgi:hypothetical protein